MKQNSTLVGKSVFIIILCLLSISNQSYSQITLVLGSPATSIYGLTSNGEIYEISTTNATATEIGRPPHSEGTGSSGQADPAGVTRAAA